MTVAVGPRMIGGSASECEPNAAESRIVFTIPLVFGPSHVGRQLLPRCLRVVLEGTTWKLAQTASLTDPCPASRGAAGSRKPRSLLALAPFLLPFQSATRLLRPRETPGLPQRGAPPPRCRRPLDWHNNIAKNMGDAFRNLVAS
jgi:hypothetical protein